MSKIDYLLHVSTAVDAGANAREFLVAPGHALELRCRLDADWLLVYTVFPFTPPVRTQFAQRVQDVLAAAQSVGVAVDADSINFALSCLVDL